MFGNDKILKNLIFFICHLFFGMFPVISPADDRLIPWNVLKFCAEIARDALNKTGIYTVVQGIFSPVNDAYKKKVCWGFVFCQQYQ